MIPNTVTIDLATQELRIARCKAAATRQGLMDLFGTVSANRLESIIDGKVRTTAKQNVWSRKYRRYETLSDAKAPFLITDQTIERVEIVAKRSTSLRAWRDHVIWELIAEPPVSLERIRHVMVELPPSLSTRLFVKMDSSDPRTWSRYALERNEVLELRDERSLDALIALLALSREAEAVGNFPGHVLPMLCAFEILPWVLIGHRQLRACWLDLFHVLKTSFWSRDYGGYTYAAGLTAINMQIAMVAVMRNGKNPELPIIAGLPSKEEQEVT